MGKGKEGGKRDRSPKSNVRSVITVAPLSIIVNWSERKQGSCPTGDKVLKNMFFCDLRGQI